MTGNTGIPGVMTGNTGRTGNTGIMTGNAGIPGVMTGNTGRTGNTGVMTGNTGQTGSTDTKYMNVLTALTSDVSTNYIVRSSSITDTFPAWKAFDNLNGPSDYWQSRESYNEFGNYVGSAYTNINGLKYYGEWLQIQLPTSIVLDSFDLTPTSEQDDTQQKYTQTPSTFYVVASIDETNWNILFSVNNYNITWNSDAPRQFTLSTPPSQYNYFRIVIQTVGPFGMKTSYRRSAKILEWKLNTFSPYVLKPITVPSISFAATTTNTASASSTYGSFNAGFAFDGTTSFWHSGINKYEKSSIGNYMENVFTVHNNLRYYGEWLQIQFPGSRRINSFSITPRTDIFNQVPLSIAVFAANNSNNILSPWTLVYTNSNLIWTTNATQTFTLPVVTNYFLVYRLVILRASNDAVVISEWKLNTV
jgi:hypothetical protein